MKKVLSVSMAIMLLSGCGNSGGTIRNATPISFTQAMSDLSAGISTLKEGSVQNIRQGRGSFGLMPTEITVCFNIAASDTSDTHAELTVIPASFIDAQGGFSKKSTDSAKNDIVIKFKNIYFDKDGLFDVNRANAISKWINENPQTPVRR